MKLLLTSAGLRNNSIIEEFTSLLGMPVSEANLLFINTAANAEPGDKTWLIDDLNVFYGLKPKSLDIVDFTGLVEEFWLPRFETADCLIFSGGNSFHLMKSIFDHGLNLLLQDWLKTKLYVGVSAGSIITGPTLDATSLRKLYQEKYNLDVSNQALGLVDFYVRPHANNSYFPHVTEEAQAELARRLSKTVYLLDDESAVVVNGDSVSVVSEGDWKLF